MRDLMADRPLDLVVKNVRVVRPTTPAVETRDVGVKDGRIVRVAPEIAVADAQRAYDGRGRLAFPGVVDAHTHVGIYRPLAEDAVRESRAAVSGGVTAMLTYFRTGQYYLNRGGRYADFFPEVPTHSEGLAVAVAAYLAHETACVNVNLLHLSSRKALESALTMARAFPHVNFRREVTVGHLLLDVDAPSASYAKVNPPIRPREDVEYLWRAVLEGQVDWIVSDHACCAAETKGAGPGGQGDIWLAKSGFGGTEYLLAGVFSEGRRRGLPLHRMAALTAWNPARRYGLLAKGDVAPGFDADLALLDPDRAFTVSAADSPSGQGYTPFEGQRLTGQVTATFLRGELAWEDGRTVGTPRGRYLRRPTPSA